MSEAATLPGLQFSDAHLLYLLKPLAIKNRRKRGGRKGERVGKEGREGGGKGGKEGGRKGGRKKRKKKDRGVVA